ncbi:MAG: class I SAM-dependent methyltransferase [Gammaproteobacteria bacterium]|nr:class I SAM-dependent methyltransferase [Gammaproteobacteria bacterium]
MEDYQLLVDLHKRARRQGPGGDAETKKAIDLAMLDHSAPLKIADIGCGTGSSAMLLAQSLNAQITAVDFLPDFIEVLKTNAENEGLTEKINPLVCSMDKLQFASDEFDVIWSEGAIYNMGFENGINAWRRFLKPGGLLVVSEITWTTDERPCEIQDHWESEYPEIGTASSKMRILENSGYSPLAYFVLPEHCWLDNYYRPMQNSFADFLARNANSESAQEIVEAEKQEIALYKKYKQYFGYGVYVARKLN